MITPKTKWQQALREVVSSTTELLELVGLTPTDVDYITEHQFPLRVPRSFIARMRYGDPHCPLLKQVLASPLEIEQKPGFEKDPLQEKKVNPVPGLLHKFTGRVLLTLSSACAIHCRFCFRKYFPYAENRPTEHDLQPVLAYLHHHPEINEVIFSGGDPLSIPDEYLGKVVERLQEVPHLKYLRIHSRFPIVIPERLTKGLVQALTQKRLKSALILHCNHPEELSQELLVALKSFQAQGISLFNQTVLLKGINDNSKTLQELIETLYYEANVLPYYIHLLDRVEGSAHFEVEETTAKSLMQLLAARLPGFLLPRLVREVPGAPAKVWIDWNTA